MGKRVLFISHDASRTGAPMVLLHLLGWLRANAELPFDILLRNGGELSAQFEQLATVYCFNSDQPSGRVRRAIRRIAGRTTDADKARQRILRELSRRDIGLVYSNTVVNGRVMEALASLRCPMICHVHELSHWIDFETDPQMLRLTKKNATHYIAASRAVKDNLVASQGLPAERIDVIHEFIPTEALSRHDKVAAKADVCRRYGVAPDSVLVGACGTIDWRKGADLFIHVARAALRRDSRVPIEFLWIGGQTRGGAWGKLVHDVDRAGLRGHVHFLGTHADPAALFAALDIFVLPSREDPYPLVMLEAAAAGSPIVCFDRAGGAPEFVEDDAGVTVPYLDLQAMGEALVRLAQDASWRRRLARRATEKVCLRHDVHVAAPQALEVLKRFLEPDAAGARRRDAA